MPRYAAQVDRNQSEIIATVKSAGVEVLDLSATGGGVPDIAVPFRGTWYFIEIKRPEKRGRKSEYTPAQVSFRAKYGHLAPIYTAYSADDVFGIIGLI